MRGAVGLYDPAEEKDSCGVGLAVNTDGAKDHRIVEYGLRILENMEHRGAENADGRTGDGTGITLQVPHEFIAGLGIPVPESGRYGTGLIFLPKDGKAAGACMDVFRGECGSIGLTCIAERDVPVDHSIPGPLALETEPHILQVFLTSYDSPEVLEHKLYSVRKRTSNRIAAMDPPLSEDFYICSLSSKVIVYKGMLTPAQIRSYYKDLSDPSFKSALAMVHSRFSTNTLPMWKLAQPFRMLCHNGEINTIKGNRAWMGARESVLESPLLPDIGKLFPVIQNGMSDSASLDNVFEFLTMTGKSMPNALSLMIPESWNNKNPIPDSLKAYYEYHSILMEPWDGPAAVLFTDGRFAGGMLDRNGLRPARYTITNDGLFILASEAGVIPTPESEIREAGRLRPGKMMIVDTAEAKVIYDREIKSSLSSAYPYRDWLNCNRVELDEVSSGREVTRSVADSAVMFAAFGYNREEISKIIEPMAMNGKEPIGSTGSDIPLAILSDRPQRLFNYFRQSFAQITNPPIDPIREELVMSVTGYIGPINNNILDPTPKHCNIIKVRHPIITNRELDLLENLRYRGFGTAKIETVFPIAEPNGLEKALDDVCRRAEEAVDSGGSYIILSDRAIDADHAAIPSLLAVSAVHQHLLSKKKRLQTGIILESGEPREVMHFALLIGYGANVVNPYMAYAAIAEIIKDDKARMDAETAEQNFIRACEKGMLKVMSKMGIATIRSYRGSCLFEAVGIDKGVAARYFGGTASRIGGMSLEDIAGEAAASHLAAYAGKDAMSEDPGVYGHRKDGERHSWNPETVKLLQSAVRGNDEGSYKAFSEAVDGGSFFIRSLMDVKKGRAVPLDEVESAASIMKRFVAEGISFGAISKESHEDMAEAMNGIGGQSNTGEGGEDPVRFKPLPDGRDRRSKVKQIASGRFGVTAQYLVNADEIQIKIAQGAKPGEGGQLLGPKVDEVIAATRHTMPGITLISPPPHHDIYSIEDLKQLIFDMKCINPTARVSVKLVAEAGVGTVAAGAAKAGADVILISGADGGTGASPLSSIRYAGLPWELGLAETQQTLMANGLRGRVRIQTDGQMKTGRDVIIAALLGAEEYGFSTAPMVALGCIMCRKCHTNACPVGIATQDAEKRARYKGSPEHLANYMRFIAEDVRRRLSEMGFRTLEEAVGRSDLILRRQTSCKKAGGVDISPLLEIAGDGTRTRAEGQPDTTLEILDRRMIRDAAAALEAGAEVKLEYGISNIDRSVGTMLSGAIAGREGKLKDGAITVTFNGAAGQSFGAFLSAGMTFILKGQANDYVGKGLSGGKIAVFHETHVPNGNVIAGNTILYGATSGEVYISGKVGERFCVRNSGATAVAEGVGDHCCEYMTGGRVVVLGEAGRNFAAGMSAGIAYVLNDRGDFDRHCNMDMVELSLVDSPDDRAELRKILESHVEHTGSPTASEMLEDWNRSVGRFLKVMPIGYKRLLDKGVAKG
ncbi:MAG: glutamate synthase large subunit [Candidatus Methanoplasma sp.]|jgi:glutamate synthase (NADPH/NADH) large chain|nr:glutamate synthase large subunit [Candidatus Methanoplasma sp.]